MISTRLFPVYIQIAFFSTCLLIASGCSSVSVSYWASAVDGNDWVQSTKSTTRYKPGNAKFDVPPDYYYSCKNMTIEIPPVHSYDYVLSAGPYIFPIIPLFMRFGDTDALVIRVNLVNKTGKFNSNNLTVYLPSKRQTLTVSKIKVANYSNDEAETIDIIFDYDVTEIDKFKLIFNNTVEGCLVPPLEMKIDHLSWEYGAFRI